MSAGISAILLAEGGAPAGPTDPDWVNVYLRQTLDDPTAFADVSPSPLTVTNTGVTSLVGAGGTPKFGADAARFASAGGNELDIGSAAGSKFMHDGSIAFSLEYWFNTGFTGAAGPMWRTSNGSTAGSGFYMEFEPLTGNVNVYMFRSVIGTLYFLGIFPAALNTGAPGTWQWIHFTFDPAAGSNEGALAVDGGTEQFASVTGNAPSSSNPDRALRLGDGAWSIDDTRITKNIIRPNTLPTAAFPTS